MANYTRFQLRGDTKANWLSVNPILAKNEPAIETDTNRFKIGDGVSTYSQLSYGRNTVEYSSLYNVTSLFPLPSGYYSHESAVLAIPGGERIKGLIITYETASGVWYTERFIGTNASGWTTVSNWERIPNASDVSRLDSNISTTTSHIANKSNPHEVTKSQVGLGNVDNTSDIDKPISTLQQAAITATTNAFNGHVANTSNPHSVTKSQVGLSNVDNTSDSNKPISIATQTALNGKVNNSGNESIAGVKTFEASPIVPTPTSDNEATNKVYVDEADNQLRSNLEQLAGDKVSTNFLGVELSLVKPESSLVYGERVAAAGYIIPGYVGYRTGLKPVTVGKRYAAVHGAPGQNPTFTFFSSPSIGSASFVSQLTVAEATVPAGATHMVINFPTILKDVLIVMQMDSGFPILGQETFIYTKLATKIELGGKAAHGYTTTPKTLKQVDDNLEQLAGDKVSTNFLGVELSLVKPESSLVYGERVAAAGYIIPGYVGYRTGLKPVTVGKRYAAVHGAPGQNPTFTFFSSPSIGSASFVSQLTVAEATVPAGATHMVINFPTILKDVLIVMQMDSGFPILGQETFIYTKLATKIELGGKAAHGYTTTPKTLKQVDDKTIQLDVDKLNIDNIGLELNIVRRGVTTGTRINPTTKNPELYSIYFITHPQPVAEGEIYTSVSESIGSVFTFFFYNSNSLNLTTYIAAVSGRTATVPAGATYMVVQYLPEHLDNAIVMNSSEIETTYPILGQNTLKLTDIYRKEEIDVKLNLLPEWYGVELNILKKTTTEIVDGSRTDNSGGLLPDANAFRTNSIPVSVGERYAGVNLDPNPIAFFRFSFYSKKEISSSSFISRSESKDVIVPAGAKYMVFAANILYKDSTILQRLADGFPIVDSETIHLTNAYTKKQIDARISPIENGVSKWYPDVFDLNIISVQSNGKVLLIEDNVLYGSNSHRDIFKATQVDLSDKISVCQLPEGATLLTIMFVSANKAVGYVAGDTITSGFYCFDNADTNAWTARKVGEMLVGFPAISFQSMIKLPDSQYLFAISYSTGDQKITDPLDTTTEAPRHIYRSVDLGETWQIVYTHHERLNTHMHAIEYDIFRNRIWCAIGDFGAGGDPGWVYSDDNGDTWAFVPGHMDTAILPTRKYVLFGSDSHPARLDKWEPYQDIKNAVATNDDVNTLYKIPVEQAQNFGFARRPAIDTSSYPYKIAVAFAYTANYSKSCMLLSPNYKDWYMLDLQNNPGTELWWDGVSGITSDGWVLGWCNVGGINYYRRFKYPNWIEN